MDIYPEKFQEVSGHFKIMRFCVLYQLLSPACALRITSSVSNIEVISPRNSIFSIFINQKYGLIRQSPFFK